MDYCEERCATNPALNEHVAEPMRAINDEHEPMFAAMQAIDKTRKEIVAGTHEIEMQLIEVAERMQRDEAVVKLAGAAWDAARALADEFGMMGWGDPPAE